MIADDNPITPITQGAGQGIDAVEKKKVLSLGSNRWHFKIEHPDPQTYNNNEIV